MKIGKVVPPPVKELRDRVDDWRQSKGKKHRMPKELWKAAVVLAKSYGVHFVASNLSLGYSSLKQKAGGNWGPVKSNPVRASFVEIAPSSNLLPLKITLNEIELRRPDGHLVLIRNADTDCVSQIAKAFWGNV